MKPLTVRFTRPDDFTQPGGIIIREREEEPRYLVHNFSRDRGAREPNCFFWGAYCHDYAEAWDAFTEKCNRASNYTAGGALIPIAGEEAAIAAEREPA